jgi:predicted amidohydrolase
MRVAAISLAEINLTDTFQYRAGLAAMIKKTDVRLALLPAYGSLLLGLGTGEIKSSSDFNLTLRSYLTSHNSWNQDFLELHSSLARKLGLYISAGPLPEIESGNLYFISYCFGPDGETCCRQPQTHLTRVEREMGASRGEELTIFALDGLRGGLVVGNDARHPEVGRIFAMRGADIILHCGAIEAGFNCWAQVAGIWAQVQQNQFWAVEAQLCGQIADRFFGAGSAIIGPCEITPGKSGYLARGYPQTPVITAVLDEEARRKIKEKYPLLSLLNPEAYSNLNV